VPALIRFLPVGSFWYDRTRARDSLSGEEDVMARLRVLLRCIGEAVCVKGPKALFSLVPFGEVLFDIAEEAYRRLRESSQQEQVAAIAAAAGASTEEARAEAEAAVAELPCAQALPLEAQIKLVSYLSQVPSVVRQTLKRPSDPAGKTVPPSFTLKKAEQLLTLLPQRLPSLKVGDRVANWELVELLGAGGFGEVWLARHPSLHGLKAALKFCLDPAAASTLRHEAALLDRVMQQGKHPGIVPLRQAYLEREPLCLEYEYVNGGDLAALLGEWQRGGKVPRNQVNRLVQRLAEIVGHAHKLSPPIVHRDLKPANILIERSPDNKIRLRVTDFGIGGVASTQALLATHRGGTSRGEQLSTALRGSHTPIYASPQQVRGEAPDPRDDVHALGVIWYQLLVGDLTGGIPTDWMTVLQDLGQPRPLIDLLGACVASRPDKRLASAGDLAEKLAAELDNERVLDVIPVAQPAPPPVAELWVPPVTKRRPAEQPETVRPARPVTRRGQPVEAPLALPAEPARPAPPAPARSGTQVRRYPAPGLRLGELLRDLEGWLHGEGFNTQDLKTESGASLLQIEQQGGWRKFVGMSTALNVILEQRGDELTVEVGAGQWLDKAAAGVVSLFVLWPLAVTAAIGAWNQMKMPERIFGQVNDFLAARPAPPVGGLSSDAISQLRDLAGLRDQGVLTEEEFQAEKARLLGRS
jgi:serine/threonine protein kinase